MNKREAWESLSSEMKCDVSEIIAAMDGMLDPKGVELYQRGKQIYGPVNDEKAVVLTGPRHWPKRKAMGSR